MSYAIEFRFFRDAARRKKGAWLRRIGKFSTKRAAQDATGTVTAFHRDLADVRVRKVAK